MGIPQIGCQCAVCNSEDKRDKRLRPSALLECGNRRILIDIGPDFRQQMLKYRVRHLDGILLTHSHADHILGIDDLRTLYRSMGKSVVIYGTRESFETIRRIFFYAFLPGRSNASRPVFDMVEFASETFSVAGVPVTPIPIEHGDILINGFRIGKLAYITDGNRIPAKSYPLLKDLDVLVINALRRKYHPSHFTLDDALNEIKRVAPNRAFITHIGHDLSHGRFSFELNPSAYLAYDGLTIDVEE